MMEAAEFAAGMIIGLVVGLLGGGGAVLTVPLLVLGFGLEPATATTTSLAVVAAGAAVGLVVHGRAGAVRWRTGAVLSGLGVVGNVAGSLLATVVAGPVILVAFAVLLVATGVRMLRTDRPVPQRTGGHRRYVLIAVATGIGFVTGFLGVGGGFLVVPALVLVIGLPEAAAVGTSLFVLLLSAAVGLATRAVTASGDVAWPLTVLVAAGAAAGAGAGALLSARVPAAGLRRGFGVLLLVVAPLTLVGAMVRS